MQFKYNFERLTCILVVSCISISAYKYMANVLILQKNVQQTVLLESTDASSCVVRDDLI